MRRISAFTTLCALAWLAGCGVAAAADLKVFSDNLLRRAVESVTPDYTRETGNKVDVLFGLSDAMHRLISMGEVADVLILQPEVLEQLQKAGMVDPGERTIVARAGLGLVMRTGAANQDVATPDALKRALLSADKVVINNVASGDALLRRLDTLALGDAFKRKLVRLPPVEVIPYILDDSGKDIAIGVVPQMMMTRGVTVVGELPEAFQIYLDYAAAVMSASLQPEAAKSFIAKLSDPQTRQALAAAGLK